MGRVISLDEVRSLKLGKGAPLHDPRNLLLSNYIKIQQLPPILAMVDWSRKVHDWRTLANNEVGDCTVAAAGHMEMLWSAYAQPKMFTPTDQLILHDYSAITGYDPHAKLNANGENPTDNGAIELNVLKYWRGVGIAGRKITAFAAVRPSMRDHVRAAIMLFGGIYIGIALPTSAQHQIGSKWDVKDPHLNGDSEPGSWGGHAVPVIAYDATGLTCVTWGALQKMTWAFWTAYCDEAYAVFSADFLDSCGRAPSGFNAIALQKDLSAVAA